MLIAPGSAKDRGFKITEERAPQTAREIKAQAGRENDHAAIKKADLAISCLTVRCIVTSDREKNIRRTKWPERILPVQNSPALNLREADYAIQNTAPSHFRRAPFVSDFHQAHGGGGATGPPSADLS